MNYRIAGEGERTYIECLPGDGQIESENDALDVVAICGEHQIHRLMLHSNNLTDDFYQLRTGLAGAVLQKFANYRIKVAAVLHPEQVNQGRFREMALEANRSNREFHIFYEREQAEQWLVGPA